MESQGRRKVLFTRDMIRGSNIKVQGADECIRQVETFTSLGATEAMEKDLAV